MTTKLAMNTTVEMVLDRELKQEQEVDFELVLELELELEMEELKAEY